MDRIIIFGDIHGCLDEWRDLLKKINPTKHDRLISVGDLICKGPYSRETLDFAMTMPQLQCIVGNHELHFLNAWKNGKLDGLSKDYQKSTLASFSGRIDFYMEWISTWPFYLDLPECLVVHGGLRPGTPLKKQAPSELCNLRTLEDGTAWHEHYSSSKLVVYGHWARQGLCVKENSIGLDSGCVYGKTLSAVILPERKIVQVDARKTYLSV